jgi:alpha-L-fucosidase
MKRIIFFLLIFSNLVIGQTLFGGGEANPDLLTNKESLGRWQEMRFGMFIHWGPVALRGTEIGWSRANQVPADEYDQLYKEFNPINFNADAWMALAKTAGMKYLVFVTKHHDGFSLWDTEYSDYDIMAGPFKRDIVAELAAACKKQDILFGT